MANDIDSDDPYPSRATHSRYVALDWLTQALRTHVVELVLSLITVGVPMWYQIDGARATASSASYPYRNHILVGWIIAVATLFTYAAYNRFRLRHHHQVPSVTSTSSPLPTASRLGASNDIGLRRALASADDCQPLLTQIQADINAALHSLVARPLLRPIEPHTNGNEAISNGQMELDLRDGAFNHFPSDHHIVVHVFLPPRRATTVLPRYLTAPGGPSGTELETLVDTLRVAEVLDWNTPGPARYRPNVQGSLEGLFPIRDGADVHLWQAPVMRVGQRLPYGLISVIGPMSGTAHESLVRGVAAMITSAAEIVQDFVYDYYMIASRFDGIVTVELATSGSR